MVEQWIKNCLQKLEVTQTLSQARCWAVNRVKLAIKSGILKRAKVCEICGENQKIQAHHQDYNNPLIVNWLCYKCHIKVHVIVRKLLKMGLTVSPLTIAKTARKRPIISQD